MDGKLLNLLVVQLTDGFNVELAANAKQGPEDLFEVLVGACVDGTSVSSLRERSQDAPQPNTITYHLREQFDVAIVEHVANTLLQTDVLETLPEQVEVVVDFHLRPYYGDGAETMGLYHSQAKAGTTTFHSYVTLYARVRNKRYTLAVRRLTDGDTASDVLAEFFAVLENLDVSVEAVYLDREFYDSKCLRLPQAHNYAYILPIVKWGKTSKQ